MGIIKIRRVSVSTDLKKSDLKSKNTVKLFVIIYSLWLWKSLLSTLLKTVKREVVGGSCDWGFI